MSPGLEPASWFLIGGLVLASVSDVVRGRIPPELSVVMLLLGGVFFLSVPVGSDLLAAIGLIVIFTYGWYYVGAMGGADVKLICALCLLMPRAPVTVPLAGPAMLPVFPFPLAVVLLALILAQAVSIPLFLIKAWERRKAFSTDGMSAALGIIAGVALFLLLNPHPEHMLVPALIAVGTAMLAFLRVRKVDVRVPFAPFLLIAVVVNLLVGDPFRYVLQLV